MRMKTTTTFQNLCMVGLLAAALTACSSSSSEPGNRPSSSSATNFGSATNSGSAANSGPAKLVPSQIRSRGSITVVTDATYPPYGFFAANGSTIQGIDVDTVHALEPLLAVPIKVVNASFDSFIPELKAGRYDAGFNAITDNSDRRAVVDFIDFQKYGNFFLTAPNSGLKMTAITSACGLTVGAENGGDTIPIFKDAAPRCQAMGKPAPNVKIFNSQAAALSAMTSGRVQAVLSGSDSGYLAKHSSGKYVVNGSSLPNIAGDFYIGGLAVEKGSPLAPALLAAMKELYLNGTLKSIYAKYGISADILIAPRLDTGSGPTPTVR